ncbi:MAG: hypothetical protein Q8K02_16975 [Flavobacterium sp.]|nr:hypothetical protein [Flavobacterium sp.]
MKFTKHIPQKTLLLLFFLAGTFGVFSQGLFSAKVYLNSVDWGATRYYNVDTNLACDPGVYSNWDNVEVARLEPGSILNMGGNLISFGGDVFSAPRLYYRMYLDGSAPGAFSYISLSTKTNVCNSGDIKHESIENNTPLTLPSEEGIYILEVYFRITRDVNPQNLFWSNLSQSPQQHL